MPTMTPGEEERQVPAYLSFPRLRQFPPVGERRGWRKRPGLSSSRKGAIGPDQVFIFSSSPLTPGHSASGIFTWACQHVFLPS